jgi:hypothetical protein
MKGPVVNASCSLNKDYDRRRLGSIAVLGELVTVYKH